MPTIVGIRFTRAGKIYYFDSGDTPLKVDEYVIVETKRGHEMGRVVIAPKQVLESELNPDEPLLPIERKATPEDTQGALALKNKEPGAAVRCKEQIQRHDLPMKLVASEYNFDGSRLTFYFTSENRVDFRALVRDLASIFRTRIELRQIGPRDHAKMLGGLGRCGKTLCCSTWLGDFAQVSIKMAKEQDLPANPSKISGVCGRLLCCLSYENEVYVDAKARLPKTGSEVKVEQGVGEVVGINALKETVLIAIAETGTQVEVPATRVEVIHGPIVSKAGGCGSGCSSGGCGVKKKPAEGGAHVKMPDPEEVESKELERQLNQDRDQERGIGTQMIKRHPTSLQDLIGKRGNNNNGTPGNPSTGRPLPPPSRGVPYIGDQPGNGANRIMG